jgi:UDP-2,3-diacylglucosamine pyrophosphatase LpxH
VDHTETVTVDGTNYFQTRDSDGDTNDHYVLALHGDTVEIDESDYAWIRQGMAVPIRVAITGHWALGASATISLWHGGFLTLAAFAFWISYRARRHSTRPWFRRKVNDGGSGRLPDSG